MNALNSSPWLIFTFASLAAWRITHLLQAEDGPFDLIVKLRNQVGHGFFGQLMDCFYCLSVWIALPFAWLLTNTLTEGLIMWLALSGAAIFLQRIHAMLLAWENRLTQTPLFIEETASNDLTDNIKEK